MKKIVNLTPHDITIMDEQKEVVLTVPPSGKVARLDSDKEVIDTTTSYYVGEEEVTEGLVSFFATKYGIPMLVKMDKEGKIVSRSQFPPVTENTIYIVSGLFRAGYDRLDLWQPGELVRDSKGIPIGCIGLSQ